MNASKVIGTIITGTSSVAGVIVAILQWAGVEFDGFLGVMAALLPIWLPVVSFIFGVCIGWYARGRSKRVARSDRKIIEKRARERDEENFIKAKRAFYQLEPDIKALMLAALEKGGAYCESDEWRLSRLPEDDFIAQFVETRYIDGDIAKITALPLLEKFIENVPDAFDGISSTLERHGRDRGSGHISSFSTSFLDWWWFR